MPAQPPTSKKTGHPPLPTLPSAKKLVGPIIFKIGRGGPFCSSIVTCVSPGVSDETGKSPRPYSQIGRTGRSSQVAAPPANYFGEGGRALRQSDLKRGRDRLGVTPKVTDTQSFTKTATGTSRLRCCPLPWRTAPKAPCSPQGTGPPSSRSQGSLRPAPVPRQYRALRQSPRWR